MGCGASKQVQRDTAAEARQGNNPTKPKVELPQGSTKLTNSSGDSPKAGTFGNLNFILANNGSLTQFYTVEAAKIGQGSYGSVTKGTNKSTGVVRAIKTISKSQVKNIERFRLEISIMKQMDHPNIIKLFETFEDHRNIYLVMELCTGGELFDRIIELGHLTEHQAAIIMQQILRAVFYMHQNKVMHRDLKPENFLFSTKESVEKSPLKIIDFGLSAHFEAGQTMSTKAGTPYYVAPQVLAGKYDESCDIWSCGVIMFILLCGYPPFYGDTDAEVLRKVREGVFTFNPSDWRSISDDAKDLIRKMLQFNPKDRYTAEQALNHIWVKKTAPKAVDAPLETNHFENLKNFRAQNKLKKAALHIIAQQMPDSEVANLKNIFVSIDKNGDGQLTVAELMDGIKKSGINVDALGFSIKEVLANLDSNASGVIDYTEFIAATLEKKKYMREDRLWSAFRVFDVDGNGQISKAELQKILLGGNIDMEGDRSIDDLIKECDVDGDGEISFDEFVKMMSK
jgi:calcium-dependent protein kinase